MEQNLRLIRDQIEETDEMIFSMQKEKEEKNRLKKEIEAKKQAETEQMGDKININIEFPDENEEEEKEKQEENKLDKASYKLVLKETIEQKLEELAYF